WDEAHATGYQKFGDYGDVIIYRPNGETDFWAQIGLLPLSSHTPIIHRAMTWVDAGEPEPYYFNFYRGAATPTKYLPLEISNATVEGYKILYTGVNPPQGNLTLTSLGDGFSYSTDHYRLPASYESNGTGFIWYGNVTTHGGYITKGDNNPVSDEGGYLPVGDIQNIEPVEKNWVVGKALFTIPLIGLLPLHIWWVVAFVLVVMIAWELYVRSKEAATGKKAGKSKNLKRDSRKNK
ncbi:MAG: hypothetical protein WCX19_13100, partial [Methanoregula sp.]